MEKTDILSQIVDNKRKEIALHKEAIPLPTLLSMGKDRIDAPTRSMRSALDESSTGLIAEFKRKSPSKGWLSQEARVSYVVPAYERAGAAVCSVLTDLRFFGGSLTDLQVARKIVDLPLLRKDFIVDDYQLYQARITGADAVLLIAACITEQECASLAEIAHSLQMEVLLEIHSEAELSYINPNIDMIGVNNRNLGSFQTNVETSFRLAEVIKKVARGSGISPLMVSESGISDAETVRRLRQVGYRGFLIGEAFMKTDQPGEALANFIEKLL